MPRTEQELRVPTAGGHPTGPRDRAGAKPFVTMLVMLVILAIGVIIAIEFSDAAKLQDCVMSGRRNCAPIDSPGDPH